MPTLVINALVGSFGPGSAKRRELLLMQCRNGNSGEKAIHGS